MINHEEVNSDGVLLDTELQSNIFNYMKDEDSVTESSQNVSDFMNRAKELALRKAPLSQYGLDVYSQIGGRVRTPMRARGGSFFQKDILVNKVENPVGDNDSVEWDFSDKPIR